jgi:tetratricopeptide (TPR) repeat protein
MDENDLNTLGYNLLNKNKTDEAIEIFKLVVVEYPLSWNAWDSLGEGYMKAGKKEMAIENYEKSIEINPNNRGGIKALQKMKK